MTNKISSEEKNLSDAYKVQRVTMVETQLIPRGITDPNVLEAMQKVPRHLFVPQKIQEHAYKDSALSIGEGQTISQPYIVGLMSAAGLIQPYDKVLEIGTGSGYAAAVLGEMAAEVYTVELLPSLAQRAADVLHQLGYNNVHVQVGDGYDGWAEKGPFDLILVTAARNEVPPPLLAQLAQGGRLIMPVGPSYHQELLRLTKEKESLRKEVLESVIFVPFRHEEIGGPEKN